MFRPAISNASDFTTQYALFFKAHRVGLYPLGLRPDGGLKYGVEPSEYIPPRPLIKCERGEVMRYVPGAGGGAHSRYKDRFISAWDDVRGEIERVGRMYAIGDASRMEELDKAIDSLRPRFRYVGKALVAEHDAEYFRERGEISAWKEKGNAAATAWLNFVRQINIHDSFARHILSHAIYYAWHVEGWRAAELLFMRSSEQYLRGDDVEEAADVKEAAYDVLRAGFAHSNRRPNAMMIVGKRIDDAIDLLKDIVPRPAELISDAAYFSGEAKRLNSVASPSAGWA